MAAQVSTSRRSVDDEAVKPAAAVWADPMPATLDEQVAFFRREGFLILRGVLGRDELAELDRELQRLAANAESLPSIREGFMLEQGRDASRSGPAFRKIGGICELSEAFDRLLRHPRILPLLHAIIGPVVELYRDVCMMKPARVGREKPWHQDSVYWPWIPMELVSAMTALDEAAPANGCLQVIPRSHLVQRQHYGDELQIDLADAEQARTRYVPLAPGDTLLFHSLILHASEPNHSDRDRRVCIYSYKSPELKFARDDQQPPEPIIVSTEHIRPGDF